jgi:hypothetical protein
VRDHARIHQSVDGTQLSLSAGESRGQQGGQQGRREKKGSGRTSVSIAFTLTLLTAVSPRVRYRSQEQANAERMANAHNRALMGSIGDDGGAQRRAKGGSLPGSLRYVRMNGHACK